MSLAFECTPQQFEQLRHNLQLASIHSELSTSETKVISLLFNNVTEDFGQFLCYVRVLLYLYINSSVSHRRLTHSLWQILFVLNLGGRLSEKYRKHHQFLKILYSGIFRKSSTCMMLSEKAMNHYTFDFHSKFSLIILSLK